jgi:hypothetical protein
VSVSTKSSDACFSPIVSPTRAVQVHVLECFRSETELEGEKGSMRRNGGMLLLGYTVCFSVCRLWKHEHVALWKYCENSVKFTASRSLRCHLNTNQFPIVIIDEYSRKNTKASNACSKYLIQTSSFLQDGERGCPLAISKRASVSILWFFRHQKRSFVVAAAWFIK